MDHVESGTTINQGKILPMLTKDQICNFVRWEINEDEIDDVDLYKNFESGQLDDLLYDSKVSVDDLLDEIAQWVKDRLVITIGNHFLTDNQKIYLQRRNLHQDFYSEEMCNWFKENVKHAYTIYCWLDAPAIVFQNSNEAMLFKARFV